MCNFKSSAALSIFSTSLSIKHELEENSLPRIGKGDRLFSGTKLDGLMSSIAFSYHSYWTKNVTVEGSDRLPALSTAMRVTVLSPVWVVYKTARSPVVVWSRTPFR